MEPIRKIAAAHYEAGSRPLKSSAENFLQQLDPYSKGCVSYPEFHSFMKQYRPDDRRLRSEKFFRSLARKGKAVLDTEDLKTLYYILMSCRPFCDLCNDFIPGTYYTCARCFDTCRPPFNVCHDCYIKPGSLNGHKSTHRLRVLFLDNYTLLEHKRPTTTSMQSQHQHQGQPSQALVQSPGGIVAHPTGNSNQTNVDQLRLALGVVQAGINLAGVVANIAACSIL